jgi:hypothetical protein
MCWAQKSAKISWCLSMHELARLPACALLLCAGAVLAQTAPSIQPSKTTTTTTITPAPSASSNTTTTATRKVNTGEIFRWVDKSGKVQYSADVPEDRKSTARKVDTRSNIVSSRVPASISGAPQNTPAPSDGAPAMRQPTTERERCEAAWQRYNEAVACFSQNRQGINGKRAGSSISAQAQETCQALPEPAACR